MKKVLMFQGVIWQRHSDTTVTSTEKGRWKIIEAAAV